MSDVSNITKLRTNSKFGYRMPKLEELKINNRDSLSIKIKNGYLDFLYIKTFFPLMTYIESEVWDLRAINENDLREKLNYFNELVEEVNEIERELQKYFEFIEKDKYKKFYPHIADIKLEYADKWGLEPLQPLRYRPVGEIDNKLEELGINDLEIDKEDEEFIRKNYHFFEAQNKKVKISKDANKIEFLQRFKFIYQKLHGEEKDYHHQTWYIFGLLRRIREDLIDIASTMEKIYNSNSLFREELCLVSEANFDLMLKTSKPKGVQDKYFQYYQYNAKTVGIQYKLYREFWDRTEKKIIREIKLNEKKFRELNKIDPERVLNDEEIQKIISMQIKSIELIEEEYSELDRNIDEVIYDFEKDCIKMVADFEYYETFGILRSRPEYPLLMDYSSVKTLSQMFEEDKVMMEARKKKYEIERQYREILRAEEILPSISTLFNTSVDLIENNITPIPPANLINNSNSIETIRNTSLQSVSPILSESTVEETNIIVRIIKVIINFLSCHRCYRDINGPSNE